MADSECDHNVTNYGFQCDDCTYITQREDDHIITTEGDYVCLPCHKKRIKEE